MATATLLLLSSAWACTVGIILGALLCVLIDETYNPDGWTLGERVKARWQSLSARAARTVADWLDAPPAGALELTPPSYTGAEGWTERGAGRAEPEPAGQGAARNRPSVPSRLESDTAGIVYALNACPSGSDGVSIGLARKAKPPQTRARSTGASHITAAEPRAMLMPKLADAPDGGNPLAGWRQAVKDSTGAQLRRLAQLRRAGFRPWAVRGRGIVVRYAVRGRSVKSLLVHPCGLVTCTR